MQYDAILFDLDGTLWDAIHVTVRTWPEVMKHHPELNRTITAEAVQALMGHTNEELAYLLFPDLPQEKAMGLMQESCDMENYLLRREGGRLYPAIPEILAAIAARYPMGIISNCQSGYVEAFLEYHQVAQLFRDHTCSGDTGERKGHNIRLICQRNGFQHALYVGDTIHDAEAAREAGCDFVWAAYGFGTVPADMYVGKIDTPAALLTLLQI